MSLRHSCNCNHRHCYIFLSIYIGYRHFFHKKERSSKTKREVNAQVKYLRKK